MAWETDNLLYGRTNSPWDLERTPGGSSGGEAAAIAAGMSAAGVGSDGGGSIRVPAHFSGICGLKPTPGRIPSTGHFPASGGPFALLGVVGPMARTVEDLRVLFEVMQGPDDGDTCAAPVPLTWPAENEVQAAEDRLFRGRRPHPGCARNPAGSSDRSGCAGARRISGRAISPRGLRGSACALETILCKSRRHGDRADVSRPGTRLQPHIAPVSAMVSGRTGIERRLAARIMVPSGFAARRSSRSNAGVPDFALSSGSCHRFSSRRKKLDD